MAVDALRQGEDGGTRGKRGSARNSSLRQSLETLAKTVFS